ncbi:MAG: hypothetical protein KGL39_30755 [Patescibacteria group bacterium]|nr:hypothetical protein [Patescibacteria group bacterium]
MTSQATDPRFAPTPTHGAALRWLLERCNVETCSTRERFDEMQAVVGKTRAWALGQPAEVSRAYQWACDRVIRDAKDRLSVFDNSRAVRDAYRDIPKPEEPKP